MARNWLSLISAAGRTPRKPAQVGNKLRLESLEGREVPAASILDVPAHSGPSAVPRAAPRAPLSDTFLLHSRPTATKVIYLDFDGNVTSGTLWNNTVTGGADVVTPGYDTNGNPTTFTNSELSDIQEVWARVAEDYAPFDVDVTTQDPGVEALKNTGGSDIHWGIRVVVGGDGSWYNPVGGVAYLTSFSWATDTNCFVFSENLTSGGIPFPKYVADAASHEVGHTLGLSHDGQDYLDGGHLEYYGGQGSGATGWGPIMGAPYDVTLTQWSKGEYATPSNTEDDLSIITADNGFDYRPDDHGDVQAVADPATVTNLTAVSGSGLIERTTDADWFSFHAGAGTIDITVSPTAVGPNLDVAAALYDAFGNLIVQDTPATRLAAGQNRIFARLTATGQPVGDYFLKVYGDGPGTQGVGFSNYGSLGQYSFSGTIPADIPVVDFKVTGVTLNETTAGQVAGFRINFSVPPDATTILDNLQVTGPTGAAIAVASVKSVAGSTTAFDVVLKAPVTIPAPSATAAGGIRIVLAPTVKDASNRLLNQDGDVTAGEATQDFFAGAAFQFAATPTGPAGVIGDAVGATPTVTDFPLTVPDSAFGGRIVDVTDINVRVTLTHPRLSDLKLELVSPGGGVVVPLVATGTLLKANLTNTRFDDQATKTVDAGLAPYTGFFLPAGPLAGLNGVNAVGTWNLRVTDNLAGSSGRVNSWALTVGTDTARDGLHVVSAVPVYDTPPAGPASPTLIRGLTLTFDEPVNPATLTVNGSDIQILHGPTGQPITVKSITPIIGSNNTQFTVMTDPWKKGGNYSVRVGQFIADVYGNGLDKDGDGRQSQVIDSYFYTINAPDSVYSSTGSVTLPRNVAGKTTIASLTVGDNITVSQLAVQMYLGHDDISKLKISLIAPNGSTFVLVNQGDATGTLFDQTVFSNAGAATIAASPASDIPYRGVYKPVDSLAFAPGTSAKGTWKLKIEDFGTAGTGSVAGRLFSWGLFIR